MKFIRLKIIVFAVVSVFLTTTWADSGKQLDEVIILGSKLGSDKSLQAVGLQIYDTEEINKSTADTLPEFLATKAGINVRSLFGVAGTNSTIDLRGFGASGVNNTLILFDGQRLNDIDIAAIDLSSIPLGFIERIEVLPGSGSVLYGNGASGGSINIVTKSDFEKSLVVAANTSRYSDPGKLGVSAAKSSDNISSFISLGVENAEGYRNNNLLKQRNVLAKTNYYLNDESVIFFTASADDQSLGLPGARRVNPDPDSDPNTVDAIDELLNDPRSTSTPNDLGTKKGYKVQAGYKFVDDVNSELNLTFAFRDKNQTAYSDFGGGFTNYLDTDLSTFSFTPFVKKSFKFNSSENILTLGLDYYQSTYESLRSLNPDTINSPIHIVEIDQDLLAAYLQNLILVNEKLSIVAGLRSEKVSTNARDTYDAVAPTTPFSSDAEGIPFDISHRENVYSLGVRYKVSKQISTFIRRESSVRFGTVDEIFEFDPSTFVSSLDPLLPQTGETSEVGLEFSKEKLQVQLAYYIASFENEIHYDIDENVANPFAALSENVNLDDTRRSGAFLTLKYFQNEKLEFNFNSTYTKAEFDEGEYEGNILPLVPRHQHNLGLIWGFYDNLAVSTNTRFVGRKYFDNDQLNNFSQIPSYEVSDIKLSWQKENLNCSLSVFNIFDEKESFDYGVKSTFTPGVYNGYPLPGRDVSLSLKYAF